MCPFAPPNGKQPFEQIVLARKSCEKVDSLDGKIVISVPSALHSHKPPLEGNSMLRIRRNVSNLFALL